MNNEVGCLGSRCLQRRRAGDEKYIGVAILKATCARVVGAGL